jgi:hypothetical protein
MPADPADRPPPIPPGHKAVLDHLTVIRACAQYARMRLERGEDASRVAEDLTQIEASVDAAAEAVRRLAGAAPSGDGG